MKKLKKLLSIVLAIAMVMSLAVSVGAAANTGTITINNAGADGETYSAYKIFDVTTNGTNYSYSIDSTSAFYSAIDESVKNGTLADFLTLTQVGSTTEYTVVLKAWNDSHTGTYSSETEYENSFTEALIKVIEDAITTAASSTPISPTQSGTADSGSVTISDLPLGYYYVTTSLGSMVVLDTTTATVNNKWEVPSVVKTVSDSASGTYGEKSDAAVGDTVYYKTTISNIYEISNLVLHDYMESGLQFDDSSVKVYLLSSSTDTPNATNQLVNGTTVYYTLTSTGLSGETTDIPTGWTSGTVCTFEIAFDTSAMTTATKDSVLVVTYEAKVLSSAEIYDSTDEKSNDNTTYVAYGNESYTTVDLTQTYVYKMNIYKYKSGTGTVDGSTLTGSTPLEGASFVIYKVVSGEKYYAVMDSNGNVTGWTTNDYNSSETTKATVLTTTSTGLLSVSGLDADVTYYIHETAAPSGYNTLATDESFVIAGSNDNGTTQGAVYEDNSFGDIKTYTVKADASADGTTAVIIENKTGSEMPETGGIGVTIFYVVGGILVLAAAGVIVISKKRRTEK